MLLLAPHTDKPPLRHIAPWLRRALRSFARHFGLTVAWRSYFVGKLVRP